MRGRRAGSIGDVGCFSFYPTKNLGGWGDGGAIVTADPELAAQIALLRSHGESPRYHHQIVGTTARLDALQAALLRVKLRHLDGRNEDRRRLGAALRAGLAGTSVELPAPALRRRRPRLPPVHRALARSATRCARTSTRTASSSAVHYPFPIHRTEAYAASVRPRAACRWPSGWRRRSARCRCSRRCPTRKWRGSWPRSSAFEDQE